MMYAGSKNKLVQTVQLTKVGESLATFTDGSHFKRSDVHQI